MTFGNLELDGDDDLLSIFSERFTIEQGADRLYSSIVFYSDTRLLGEITFAEKRFEAVFICRTTGGEEFEARTTVKVNVH